MTRSKTPSPPQASGLRGFGLDLVGGVPRVQLTLLQKWMEFYLIDHRGDAGFINQLLQMRYRKLHTPMLLVSPCCCSSINACQAST